jgi:hypothetical protein
VSLVGTVRRAASRHPQRRLASERAHRFQMRVPPECNDLHRQWVPIPDALDELGAIHRDDQPAGARRNDLFPEEGATGALQQRPLRIHLVGTVNRQVDRANSFERCERHAAGESVVTRGSRGGNAADVAQRPPCETTSNLLDRELRGRSASQADDHTWLNEIDRARSRSLFGMRLRVVYGMRHSAPASRMSASASAGPHSPAE